MDEADPPVRIASDGLTAEISPLGAELVRLADGQGNELLWDGDPAWWSGRAPILFPIVGALRGDSYRLDDRSYSLSRHGFARRREFTLREKGTDRASFRLAADAQTRAAYPFDFVLDIDFGISGPRMTMTAVVTNSGDAPMPVSFGFHPALRWPLPYGGAREEHRIRFDREEPAPVRRLDGDGLLDPEERATPVRGRELVLSDNLFDEDALIFDRLESRQLRFGAPGRREIEVAFPDMPHLGLWTKPGAGYLCIEPWQGHADPAGHAGDFHNKPGILIIAPGATRRFTMEIGVDGPSP